MNYLLSGVGLLLLYFGARALIHGASNLGQLLGVSPIVIGLTVVSYGTSTPELIVSVMSSWNGQLEIALGNVIGSNIFNVLFILGMSACVIPLTVNQRFLQYEIPLVLCITLVTVVLSLNGTLSIIEGGVFVLILVGYTTLAVTESRRESDEIRAEYRDELEKDSAIPTTRSILGSSSFVVLGLFLLVFGSRVFTSSVTNIARLFGVSEIVIGLTIVAAGTSLPEVGTSVLAAVHGKTDIAVGNVIGSNFFNITGVLGFSVLVSGQGIPVPAELLEYDMVILVTVSIICLPIFFTGHRITRWEGLVFLIYYGLYLLSLLSPKLYPLLSPTIRNATILFVVPLTVLTIGIGLYRHYLDIEI